MCTAAAAEGRRRLGPAANTYVKVVGVQDQSNSCLHSDSQEVCDLSPQPWQCNQATGALGRHYHVEICMVPWRAPQLINEGQGHEHLQGGKMHAHSSSQGYQRVTGQPADEPLNMRRTKLHGKWMRFWQQCCMQQRTWKATARAVVTRRMNQKVCRPIPLLHEGRAGKQKQCVCGLNTRPRVPTTDASSQTSQLADAAVQVLQPHK